MEFHKMFIHFPIALLLVSVILEILGTVRRDEKMHHAAYYNLIGGVAGAVLAIATGMLQADEMQERFARIRDTMAASGDFAGADAMRAQMMQTLSVHKLLALAVLAIFAVMLFWRITQKTWAQGRTPAVYLLVAVVGSAVLLSTAFYGGKMERRPARGGPGFSGGPEAGAERFQGFDRAGGANRLPGRGMGEGGLR